MKLSLVPVVYRGEKLDIGYRIDLLVQDLVIVEIKSVEAISPVHQAQIISYLKLRGRSLGLLINFNVVHLKGRYPPLRQRNAVDESRRLDLFISQAARRVYAGGAECWGKRSHHRDSEQQYRHRNEHRPIQRRNVH